MSNLNFYVSIFIRAIRTLGVKVFGVILTKTVKRQYLPFFLPISQKGQDRNHCSEQQVVPFQKKLWSVCLKLIRSRGSMGFLCCTGPLLCSAGTEASMCCRASVNSSPLSKIFKLLSYWGIWVPGCRWLAQSTVKVCWRGGSRFQRCSWKLSTHRN